MLFTGTNDLMDKNPKTNNYMFCLYLFSVKGIKSLNI